MSAVERFFGLQVFDNTAKWSPYLAVFLMAVAALYLLAVGPKRIAWFGSLAEPVSLKKKLLFVTGIAVVYVAMGSPVDLLGHLMFSAHMVSMSLAYLLAPPLLLLGTPSWMVRALMDRLPLRRFRFLIHPVLTLLFFNAAFSFYHMPDIHDAIMTNYALHTFYYMLLFVAAVLMFWHITPPGREFNRMTDLRKVGYVFASGVLLTPACALIVFAGSPMYATYSDADVWMTALGFCVPGNVELLLSQFSIGGPGYFEVLPPLDDQQLGGVIMKLMQEFVYASVLLHIFSNWFRRESKEEADAAQNDRPYREGDLSRA